MKQLVFFFLAFLFFVACETESSRDLDLRPQPHDAGDYIRGLRSNPAFSLGSSSNSEDPLVLLGTSFREHALINGLEDPEVSLGQDTTMDLREDPYSDGSLTFTPFGAIFRAGSIPSDGDNPVPQYWGLPTEKADGGTRVFFGTPTRHVYDLLDDANGIGIFQTLATGDTLFLDYYNSKQCSMYLRVTPEDPLF